MLKFHILDDTCVVCVCVCFQVLDHAERLREMEPTLLPAMLRLAELVSQNLLRTIGRTIDE